LLASVLPLDADERVTAAVAVSSFGEDGYLTMFTVQGRVKRTALSEFASVRPSGLIAINLDQGDELGWVLPTSGDVELIIVTEGGQALRFRESEIRPMGRNAAGVNGIRLEGGDCVASADVVAPEGDLLVATVKGYGKRTTLVEFRTQGRYTKGVRCIGGSPQSRGDVAVARVVRPASEVTLITEEGMALRAPVEIVPQMGRSARGTQLIELKEGDRLASVAVLESENRGARANDR
jgi:DNA gyrase subunit A